MGKTYAVYARFIVEADSEEEALNEFYDPEKELPEMDEAWIEGEYEDA